MEIWRGMNRARSLTARAWKWQTRLSPIRPPHYLRSLCVNGMYVLMKTSSLEPLTSNPNHCVMSSVSSLGQVQPQSPLPHFSLAGQGYSGLAELPHSFPSDKTLDRATPPCARASPILPVDGPCSSHGVLRASCSKCIRLFLDEIFSPSCRAIGSNAGPNSKSNCA